MIQLTRGRSGLDAGLTGKTLVRRNLALLQAKRSGTLASLGAKYWKGKEHWKKGTKSLIEDPHGKCAYCEAPTTVVAHGDVEHYRPKSVYWWLAYCDENHVFSCQICNQTCKGDNFPVSGPALKSPLVLTGTTDEELAPLSASLTPDPTDSVAVAAFFKNTALESPDLVDPCHANPEPLFQWAADDVLKEVEIQPRRGHRKAFEAVNRFLGLNREELRRARWSLVDKHLQSRRRDLETIGADDPSRGELVAEIRDMLTDDSPFAGMARFFVHSEWKLPL